MDAVRELKLCTKKSQGQNSLFKRSLVVLVLVLPVCFLGLEGVVIRPRSNLHLVGSELTLPCPLWFESPTSGRSWRRPLRLADVRVGAHVLNKFVVNRVLQAGEHVESLLKPFFVGRGKFALNARSRSLHDKASEEHGPRVSEPVQLKKISNFLQSESPRCDMRAILEFRLLASLWEMLRISAVSRRVSKLTALTKSS